MTHNTKEKCPKCGVMMYDPFGGTIKIHDEEKCGGVLNYPVSNTKEEWEDELKNTWMGLSLMGFYDLGTGIIGTDKIADWWIEKVKSLITPQRHQERVELLEDIRNAEHDCTHTFSQEDGYCHKCFTEKLNWESFKDKIITHLTKE